MPNFDFDAYNHDQVEQVDNVGSEAEESNEVVAPAMVVNNTASSNGTSTVADASEEVDKW